jgi:hypothetical protein
LRAAQRAGREVTAELRTEIEKLAASYAELTERVARAKLTGDAFFEQAQFGRDEIEQRVAARLRGAGLDVDLSSPLAGLLRLNEQLRVSRDLLTSATAGGLRDFKNAMMQGAEAGEAALRALENQLNRIADKLIDMAADSLWSKAFGGGRRHQPVLAARPRGRRCWRRSLGGCRGRRGRHGRADLHAPGRPRWPRR